MKYNDVNASLILSIKSSQASSPPSSISAPGFSTPKISPTLISMAQREKETEIQITETLILCANNCGFYGNPATKNLCVSCFQAQIRVPRSGSVKIRVHDPISRSDVDPDEAIAAEALTSLPRAVTSNRCSTCRKKVGLTGFRCRCGDLFCGAHRYSDRHECSYDYKEAGREEIRRGNPMVRAAKIVRI